MRQSDVFLADQSVSESDIAGSLNSFFANDTTIEAEFAVAVSGELAESGYVGMRMAVSRSRTRSVKGSRWNDDNRHGLHRLDSRNGDDSLNVGSV